MAGGIVDSSGFRLQAFICVCIRLLGETNGAPPGGDRIGEASTFAAQGLEALKTDERKEEQDPGADRLHQGG